MVEAISSLISCAFNKVIHHKTLSMPELVKSCKCNLRTRYFNSWFTDVFIFSMSTGIVLVFFVLHKNVAG